MIRPLLSSEATLTLYEDIQAACADIVRLKKAFGVGSAPSAPVLAKMVLRELAAKLGCSEKDIKLVRVKGRPKGLDWFTQDDAAATSVSCAFVIKTTVGVNIRPSVIVSEKRSAGNGMYHVQCADATSTFHIYDQLALSGLAAEAAGKIRKSLLEAAFGG